MKDRPTTRRGILLVVSSVYDPLGFVAPFILTAKLILQDLCKKKPGWDDKIPEDFERWKAWNAAKASRVFCWSMFQTSRFWRSRLLPTLLFFWCFSTGLWRSVLSVASQREELEYRIEESFFWTDSTCVLRYVENKGRRYQTFVANRVSAISEQSSPIQWKYVETNLNPTDDASRGLTVDAIVGSNRWCMGPCFLWQNEESWPQRPAAMYEDREEELRTSEENTTTFLSVAHPANQVINKLFERFSLRFQLKKCVAWMLWFKDCWRNAVAKRKRGEVIQPCSEKKLSPLDVKEMEAAEKAIIRAVQGLGFYEELLSLRTVQREVKKSSSIVKLDPVFVEGIICVGGRLHNSPIKKEAKHPVILLKDHHVSEPIMHHYHLISGNSGLEHTPSLIRQKYWIIQVRIPLCHILNSCFDCRRRQAAVGQQKMTNLPGNRVTP